VVFFLKLDPAANDLQFPELTDGMGMLVWSALPESHSHTRTS
jgi:hypothetical protein